MINPTLLLLALILSVSQLNVGQSPNQAAAVSIIGSHTTKTETTYDADKTTVRLVPIQISGENGKYHSLQMSPSFSFSGHREVPPPIIDFELQTVVRGRLRTDLYVVFIVDGEKVFLSSSRWAIKRPVPGRVWVGERLVFRMPYETFVKITKANTFEIKFDAVTFSVGETQKQALRDFLTYMKPASQSSP
ncbi:MAG TPA: hypothetical protein VKC61_17200 [Pyrinomonadaceae bacterium]|nr:hypothetical protein [Pyrinomonadaceae bacterium]